MMQGIIEKIPCTNERVFN